MNKIATGIKTKGRGVLIPECNRSELPLFLKESGFVRGAEVGVYKGEYSEQFCKAGLTHFAVDPWMAFAGQGRSQKAQERQDFIYGHTHRQLDKYPNCTMIRKTSMDALADFPDRSLDYVYLDGDHSFRFVAEDIVEWSKKVKIGGIVSGHDYWNTSPHASNVVCHVEAVVDAYTKLFNIEEWWVFGQMFPLEKQKKDDRWLSWMWFNK